MKNGVGVNQLELGWISPTDVEIWVPQNTGSFPARAANQPPMGIPSPTRLVNSCANAYPHIETLQLNLIRCGLVYSGSRVPQNTVSMHAWAAPLAAHGQPTPAHHLQASNSDMGSTKYRKLPYLGCSNLKWMWQCTPTLGDTSIDLWLV